MNTTIREKIRRYCWKRISGGSRKYRLNEKSNSPIKTTKLYTLYGGNEYYLDED